MLKISDVEVTKSGDDIIVLPKDGNPGWLFRRGDIGRGEAERLMSEAQKGEQA